MAVKTLMTSISVLINLLYSLQKFLWRYDTVRLYS